MPLIAQPQSIVEGGRQPGHFPAASLDQKRLDRYTLDHIVQWGRPFFRNFGFGRNIGFGRSCRFHTIRPDEIVADQADLVVGNLFVLDQT
jgi:hypothetical protein